MANSIKPQEIIDIAGLEEDIQSLEAATKKYDVEASKMLDGLSKRVKTYRTEIQDLIKALSGKSVDGDFTKEAKGLADYKNTISGLAAAQERLTKSIDLTSTSVVELKQRQKDLIAVNSALKTETNQDTEAIKNNEKALKETSAAVNKLTSTMKDASRQVKYASGTYNELQQSLTNDVKALKNLDGAFSTTNGKIAINQQKIKDLTASIKQKQDALKEVDKQMGFNQRNVGNYSSAMAFLVGGVRGAIGSFGTWGIAIVAVGEALQSLNGLILQGEALRRTQIGVENVSSSSLEAGINLDFLRGVADKLGLEIESLNRDFKLFAGATEQTALEGAKTRKMFEGITTAFAAMQLTADEASGGMRAFSQMLAKNTLQSEELKGQLAERLPSAIKMTADALGYSTQKLMEEMKAGRVLAADVLPKLAESFQRVYGQEALKNVETLTGSTTRLGNAWKEFLNAETSPLRKFLVWIYDKITGTLQLLSRADRGSPEERRQVEGQAFGGLDNSGDMASAIRRLKNTSKAYIVEQNKIAEAHRKNGYNIGVEDAKARIKQEEDFFVGLVDLYKRQKANEITLEKTSNDAKAKINAEAQEKIDKANEKAANKLLIEQRKQYQTELRENQANEKKKLGILKISKIEGTITEQEHNEQRLKIANDFTNQRILLSKKFVKLNSGLAEEMKDDEARNNADLQDNHIEFLELKARELQDYYKKIKSDLIDSFSGMKGDIQSQIDVAESGTTNTANLANIGVGKREIGYENQIFGERKASNATQFKIEYISIGIEKTKQDIINIGNIYKEAYDKFVKEKYDQLEKIDKGEGTLLQKIKAKQVIQSAFMKQYTDLDTDQASKVANKKEELSNRTTDLELANIEVVKQAEKESFDKKMEYITGGLEIISQIENSIANIQKINSDKRLNDLEKQKEYELKLAGDNADAKESIEAKYSQKIIEEKKKQDRREKMSAIFQIILNNQIAKMKALASGNVAQLFLAGIMGQIALLTAIATPLPEYAKGKRKGDSYKGLAVVGEKGSEIVERDGKATLVDKASVTYVDPSTRVYTASETENILRGRRLSDSKVDKELRYNNNFLKTSSNTERMKMVFDSTFRKSDLSLLKSSLSHGIEDGFEKATIVINNNDGGVVRHKRGNSVRDISKISYAR